MDENPESLDYDVRFDKDVRKRTLKYEIIKVDKKEHLILYDEDFITAVRDSRKWFLDATFAVVPKIRGVRQFLTIMAEKYGKVYVKIDSIVKNIFYLFFHSISIKILYVKSYVLSYLLIFV